MYRCFLVRGEHANIDGPAICAISADRQSFVAPVSGGGTTPLLDVDGVLRRHFAGPAPEWANSSGALPAESVLLAAAEALEQTPESAALPWPAASGQRFVPSDWAWQAIARCLGDPTAEAMPDSDYALPLMYAPAIASTPRDAVALLAHRHYPDNWASMAASMADVVDSGRLTDLGTSR